MIENNRYVYIQKFHRLHRITQIKSKYPAIYRSFCANPGNLR
ncbi:hypothetical protein M107_2911 [Bacteroides fragilis str. 3725 D9(v)]|uniref:Uncharacterized protein n=2 Tax=Bacteroides fragilis TaxID=817 RepID=A0A016AUR5_BACFG|nr:hypothetical protein M077_3074 [Bacteroides fragilis str. 2-F-2 \